MTYHIFAIICIALTTIIVIINISIIMINTIIHIQSHGTANLCKSIQNIRLFHRFSERIQRIKPFGVLYFLSFAFCLNNIAAEIKYKIPEMKIRNVLKVQITEKNTESHFPSSANMDSEPCAGVFARVYLWMCVYLCKFITICVLVVR